jgi:hypothetical protein
VPTGISSARWHNQRLPPPRQPLEPLDDHNLRDFAGVFAALDLPYPPPRPSTSSDAQLALAGNRAVALEPPVNRQRGSDLR